MNIGGSPITRGKTIVPVDSADDSFLCLNFLPRLLRRSMFFASERLKKASQFPVLLGIGHPIVVRFPADTERA